jgi:hypothetical protein
MSHHQREGRQITITIPEPFGDVLESYRHSEMAKHVRGIRREVLLTLRSLLDARIDSLRDETCAHKGEAEPIKPEAGAKRVDIK